MATLSLLIESESESYVKVKVEVKKGNAEQIGEFDGGSRVVQV